MIHYNNYANQPLKKVEPNQLLKFGSTKIWLKY